MELILQSHTVKGKLMRLRVKTVYLDAHYLQIYHNPCDKEQVNSYFVTTQTGNTVLVWVYVRRLLLGLI